LSTHGASSTGVSFAVAGSANPVLSAVQSKRLMVGSDYPRKQEHISSIIKTEKRKGAHSVNHLSSQQQRW
jgi:hypothetical protein